MDILKIIVEEVVNFLNEYEKIYKIDDLAELTSNMGFEKEIMLKIFQDMFQKGGDDMVIETFYDITHIDIYSISKGRYVFSKPVGGY